MERISVPILGSYGTLADLTAVHPAGNIGDSYLVGDDLYVWSATGNNWVNVGNIKGLRGDTGESRIACLIPLKEVARRVRKHPCTLRRWWQQDPPLFPRPRRTGPNSIGFVDIHVDDWILTRPEVGNEGAELEEAQHFSRDDDDRDREQKESVEGRDGPCVRPAFLVRPGTRLSARSRPRTNKQRT
jgi:predicted DNA-binding transcriptional regulator AlpA